VSTIERITIENIIGSGNGNVPETNQVTSSYIVPVSKSD